MAAKSVVVPHPKDVHDEHERQGPWTSHRAWGALMRAGFVDEPERMRVVWPADRDAVVADSPHDALPLPIRGVTYQLIMSEPRYAGEVALDALRSA